MAARRSLADADAVRCVCWGTSMGRLTTRRDFVRLGFGATGLALFAACAPSAPATTPASPAQPTSPPPTIAPAALPTAASTAVPKPAAAATPTAASAAPTTAPTVLAAAPPVKNVPRNRTLVLQDRGNGTYPEAELWSPYVIGQQQLGRVGKSAGGQRKGGEGRMMAR